MKLGLDDVLVHLAGQRHFNNIHISGRKGVSASLDWSLASSSQGLRKKNYMRLLVVRNIPEVVVVVCGVSCNACQQRNNTSNLASTVSLTSCLEVLQGVILESLLIEDILQVLQSQRELEDGVVDVLALLESLASGCSNGKASRCDCRKE